MVSTTTDSSCIVSVVSGDEEKVRELSKNYNLTSDRGTSMPDIGTTFLLHGAPDNVQNFAREMQGVGAVSVSVDGQELRAAL
ncbi:MAG: hypothetical protein DHS20C02_20260 [Micavibrio sp.]|nr:MAG: hypothetical protein DHS20C02_20260 [Micavibrio sp.]